MNYGLPQRCAIKKRIPKTAIYTRFALTAAEQRRMDGEIKSVTLTAELSPATIPAIAAGHAVETVYVAEIDCRNAECPRGVVEKLAKLIPQRVVFALRSGDRVAFALWDGQLIAGGWQTEETAALTLSGLDFDQVWDGFVRAVSQSEAAAQAADEIARLKKEAERLEMKMRREKTPRKKFDLNGQLKRLKSVLAEKINTESTEAPSGKDER